MTDITQRFHFRTRRQELNSVEGGEHKQLELAECTV